MKALSLPDTSRVRLQLELAYAHYGMQLPLALVAVAVAIVVWCWVPVKYGEAHRAATQLARARAEVARGVHKAEEPPLVTFKNQLLPQEDTIAQLRMILQLASNAGVSVVQVDMHRQNDASNVYSQLQITLPLKGNYQSIKRFCLDLLQGMPALSIDQLVLKHEQGSDASAQLSLSLWQEAGSKGAAP
jgi:hypothetical protein